MEKLQQTFWRASSLDPFGAGRVIKSLLSFELSSGITNGIDLNFFGLLICGTAFGWKLKGTQILVLCNIHKEYKTYTKNNIQRIKLCPSWQNYKTTKNITFKHILYETRNLEYTVPILNI